MKKRNKRILKGKKIYIIILIIASTSFSMAMYQSVIKKLGVATTANWSFNVLLNDNEIVDKKFDIDLADTLTIQNDKIKEGVIAPRIIWRF